MLGTHCAGPTTQPVPTPPPAAGGHPVRDLSDYDRAFGVDFDCIPTDVDGKVAWGASSCTPHVIATS